MVVTIPLSPLPANFQDFKAILVEATKDFRPMLIEGESYAGVVYTDGELVGLMTYGAVPEE